MKQTTMLTALLLTLSVVSTQAQTSIPSFVQTTVDHLNQYLINPIDLNAVDVAWRWEEVVLDDFGDNCRERSHQDNYLPTVAHDIFIERAPESYHYRISFDEQLIVRCTPFIDVPDDVLPAVVDALDDLNRRQHLNLSLNSLPWRWRSTQFNDYTLDCPHLIPPDDNFDQKVNGYIVTFTLLGVSWRYHVSSDRLIVNLCPPASTEN